MAAGSGTPKSRTAFADPTGSSNFPNPARTNTPASRILTNRRISSIFYLLKRKHKNQPVFPVRIFPSLTVYVFPSIESASRKTQTHREADSRYNEDTKNV